MNNELETIWREAVVVYSRHYYDIYMERPGKTADLLRLPDVLAERGTKHIQKMSLQRYHYSNVLDARGSYVFVNEV
jgi:hypothetical protein